MPGNRHPETIVVVPLQYRQENGHRESDGPVMQMFLRRFDLEHTFRFRRQTLGWPRSRIHDPSAADRWT